MIMYEYQLVQGTGALKYQITFRYDWTEEMWFLFQYFYWAMWKYTSPTHFDYLHRLYGLQSKNKASYSSHSYYTRQSTLDSPYGS